MGFAKLYSAQVTMLEAHIINIEVDISNGLHSFTIVGLPGKAIEESRDRVSAAIKNSGFTSPKQKNQKVVISLAPADLKKEGPVFDLSIAIAYLLASKEISFNPAQKIFLGELSLDGDLRPVKGILPLVEEAKRNGFTEIFVPYENRKEAALIEGVSIFAAQRLIDVLAHIDPKSTTENSAQPLHPELHTKIISSQKGENTFEHGFEHIYGQESAKRGLEIAAAGGHSVAMCGPPGTGKTMLAKAFREILPELSHEEILEVTKIHSVAGILQEAVVTTPPFRAPHHTASYVSLVGGGSVPKPGEVTLAHRGVLFLDEFPEFESRVIDSLRQPLEEKSITVSRAKNTARFPADFMLVAAMNPCPCGFRGVKNKECVCSPTHLAKYRRKISGPIVDRIDIWLQIENVDYTKLAHETQKKEGWSGGTGEEMKRRVALARTKARERFARHNINIHTNAQIPNRTLYQIAPLSKEVLSLLHASAEKLEMSMRSYHRVWKVARTIADLDNSESIQTKHLLEALQYRIKN